MTGKVGIREGVGAEKEERMGEQGHPSGQG